MNWIIWLIIGLSAAITIMGGLMCLDPNEREEGKKILVTWWTTVAVVSITTVVMTFAIKPALDSLFRLF